MVVNPNWHEGGHFPIPVPFGPEFFSCNFSKNLRTFLEVNIDNQSGSFDTQSSLSLIKMPLGGAKDENFLALIVHAN